MRATRRRADTLACIGSLLLLALVTLVGVSGLPSPPCTPRADPYPYARAIATSSTSVAYAYIYLGAIEIAGVAANSSLGRQAYAPAQATCTTYLQPAGGGAGTGAPNPTDKVAANPVFAKTLTVHANVLAIGLPNRDLTFYPSVGSNAGPAGYQSASYSAIEILPLSGTTPLTGSNQTIEDFTTPMLGALVSMKADATSLATLYDPSNIAVYTPVSGRKFSFFNVGGGASNDADYLITLPAGFLVSSMSYRGTSIAVSGFSPAGSQCFPYVLLYSFSGAAWSLAQTLPLKRVSTATGSQNVHACPASALPSGLLPIKLSDDAATLLVGAPALGTVWYDSVTSFVSGTPNYVFVASSSSSGAAGFGAQVDFSSTAGDTFFVFSQQVNTVYSYSRANWLAAAQKATVGTTPVATSPASFATNIVPNRRQQPAAADAFVDFASSSTALFLLASPNQAAKATNVPVFGLVSTGAGKYYDAAQDMVLDCPRGMYKSAPSSDPCTLCPAGTYQDLPAQTSCKTCNSTGEPYPFYCPTGSSSRMPHEVYASEAPVYLPEFDSADAGELFEELLVNTIFTRYSSPMIIFYVMLISSLLVIFVYWAPCTPERHKERALKTLLMFQYVALPNEKEDRRAKLERQIKRHLAKVHAATSPTSAGINSLLVHAKQMSMRQLDKRPSTLRVATGASPTGAANGHHTGPGGDHGGHEQAHSAGEEHHDLPEAVKSHLYHPSDPDAMTDAEIDALEDQLELEHHVDHIVCAGFFRLLLIMFCGAAVIFSIIFLSSYDWQKVHHHGDSPINRFTSETVNALNSAPVTEAVHRGLTVLALSSATITIDMFGFSGAVCDKSIIQKISLSGCVVLNTPISCADISHVQVLANEAEDIDASVYPQTDVCTFKLVIPQDSSFTSPMQFSLSLPPNIHTTAARYSYFQAAQAAPKDVDPAGDGENDALNYEIAETKYREMVLHPGLGQVDNFLQSPVTRSWNLGTLVNQHQDTLDSPIHYYQVMYNTMSDLSLNPYFATYPAAAYALDAASPSIDFNIAITSDTYYRIQTSQRLIQPGVAFLTIVLGLIGIFHMVLFGQEMCEVSWFIIKKGKGYTEQATTHAVAFAKEGITQLGSSSARSPDSNRKHKSGKHSHRQSGGAVSVAIRPEAIAGDATPAQTPATVQPLASPSGFQAIDSNPHPLSVDQPASPPTMVEMTSASPQSTPIDDQVRPIDPKRASGLLAPMPSGEQADQ